MRWRAPWFVSYREAAIQVAKFIIFLLNTYTNITSVSIKDLRGYELSINLVNIRVRVLQFA